jgi:hypothetical protein
MPLYKFTVDANNRAYECERFVSGQKESQQTVVVTGVGSKKDPAVYSDKSQPPSMMQLNARLIAHEIIKELQ